MDKSLRILLLEDNPFDAELVQHELESAKISFTAMRVETKEQFLKALTEFLPDLILSDYSLPDFSGKEALVIAKERAPDTPFILVTGSASEDTAVEFMKDGAADYILKGRLGRLAPAVEAALEFRRMITGQQQAVAALRESEMKFRALAETAVHAIVIYRHDKILYANPSVEAMSGYSLGEILSMSFLNLIHPDFRDLVAKRATARLRGDPVPPRYEVKILTKGGNEKWIDVTAAAIEYDGKPAGIATAFDITERKQKEQEFTLLAHSIKSISECVSITDANNNVLFVNEPFLKTYGYTREELIGRNISIVKSNPDERPMSEILLATLKGGWQGELLNRKKNGDEFPVYLSTSTVRDDSGRAIGLIGVATDITERKRIEESLTARARQQAAVAELGQLALEGGDLQQLMDDAVVLVAKTLDMEYCKVLELLPEEKSLLLRAGVGWRPGMVGYATVGAGVDSQAGFTLHSEQPVIVEDLLAETRFKGPPLLTEHGVVSGISVIISGRKKAFGVLGAHTTRKRMFSVDDIHFLQSIANVLAIAVQRKQAEEALRDSERRQHSILDSVNEIVYMVEARKENMFKGKLVFVSPRTRKIIGYGPEDFIGDPGLWFKLLHPEDIPTVMDKTNEMYSHKQMQTREYRIRHKLTGDYVWMEDRVVPQLDAKGEVVGQFGAARDITERKSAEQALQESEQRYRMFLQQSVEAIYLCDAQTKHVLEANPAFLKLLGYTSEAVRFLTLYDIVAHERESIDAYVDQVLQRGPIAIGERKWRRKDGALLDVDVTIGKILWKNSNVLFVVARDITERKRMQDRLTKLSSAVDQSADCVFITDQNGFIQYVNKAFEQATGYTKEEAIGKTPRILKSGKHDDAFYAKFWEEILSGKAVRVEFLNRRKNGEIYHDERTVTCLKDEKGSITNFVATGRDVTARRRTEEALRKVGDRLRFLSRRLLTVQESERRTIAREIHDELGGAFTTLKVNLQTLQSNRRQAEHASRIIDSIGIVDRAIDQIRALAISLRPSVLDDLGLPAALRWYIDRQAQRVGFVPSVSIAPSLPRFSQDVETACFRVTQEVLTNVVRHAKASKVILGLYVDKEELHLVITDDGVGFDVEKVKAQHELGLGILGMQERVSFAGGFFELESSPGRGTKVSAHFPFPAHNSSQASAQWADRS